MKFETVIAMSIGLVFIILASSVPINIYMKMKLKEECIKTYTLKECKEL